MWQVPRRSWIPKTHDTHVCYSVSIRRPWDTGEQAAGQLGPGFSLDLDVAAKARKVQKQTGCFKGESRASVRDRLQCVLTLVPALGAYITRRSPAPACLTARCAHCLALTSSFVSSSSAVQCSDSCIFAKAYKQFTWQHVQHRVSRFRMRRSWLTSWRTPPPSRTACCA